MAITFKEGQLKVLSTVQLYQPECLKDEVSEINAFHVRILSFSESSEHN